MYQMNNKYRQYIQYDKKINFWRKNPVLPRAYPLDTSLFLPIQK